ncbi:MAG: hypothetical protein AB7S38_16725 [Vulcanimicrobiota bacterium]
MSQRQVRRALRLGLGRVHLHHQAHGLEDHSESLYQACLRNLVYDAQCEPGRAAWLFPLLSQDQKKELLKRLAVASRGAPRPRDLHQHGQLCLRLAKEGYPEARQVLYATARFTRTGEGVGDDEILELDGAAGLLWLVRKALGARLPDRVLAAVLDHLIWRYDYDHTRGEAEQVLANSPFKDCLGILAPPPKAPPVLQLSKKTAALLSVSQLLECIDDNDSRYYNQAVSLWQGAASQSQLEEVAHLLAREESSHRLVHLLSIFRKRQLPLFDRYSDRFLRLVDHPDDQVRRRACKALAAVRHPAIRQLALAKLASQDWLEGQLSLFCSNLEAGDSAILARHLRVDREAERHHSLVFHLVEVCQANPGPELDQVRHFIYETSPCANCRRAMMTAPALTSPWIAAEWPFDVNNFDD